MPCPKEAIISITSRCNCHCRMCDIPLERTQELDTAFWKKAINDIAFSGAKTLVISGGEPLLRQDIFELLAFAKSRKLNTCITSNGILLDEDCAGKLFGSGISVVNISIEGTVDTHDFLRGKGNFQKAVRALAELKKRNIETTIASTVSGYNHKDLIKVVELAKEHKVTTIKFQPFNPLFLADKKRAGEFSVDNGKFQEMEATIREIISLCASSGIAVNPEKYLLNIPRYLAAKPVSINKTCSALLNSCPINSRGEIFPCWVITGKNNLIADLKKESFLDAWGSSKHLAIIKRIEKKGCPGCMMSCYDDNFGQAGIKNRVVANASKLKQLGFSEYAARILRKWKNRFKFYSAYRGSFRQIKIKSLAFLSRKTSAGHPSGSLPLSEVIKEIEAAQQLLKRELKK